MEKQAIWTFLPGLHGTPELFSEVQGMLPEDVRAEFVELPSNDRQDYPELSDWLANHLTPDTPRILIAESFSGPIALHYAEKNSHTVCGIVLAASFYSSPVSKLLTILPLRLIFAFRPPEFLLKLFLIGKDTTQEQLTTLSTAIQQTSPSVIASRVRAILRLKSKNRPLLPDMPMMILQAKEDNLISSKTQLHLEQAYPNAKVNTIQSPHLILQREPKLCLDHILDFVDTLKISKS